MVVVRLSFGCVNDYFSFLNHCIFPELGSPGHGWPQRFRNTFFCNARQTFGIDHFFGHTVVERFACSVSDRYTHVCKSPQERLQVSEQFPRVAFTKGRFRLLRLRIYDAPLHSPCSGGESCEVLCKLQKYIIGLVRSGCATSLLSLSGIVVLLADEADQLLEIAKHYCIAWQP